MNNKFKHASMKTYNKNFPTVTRTIISRSLLLAVLGHKLESYYYKSKMYVNTLSQSKAEVRVCSSDKVPCS